MDLIIVACHAIFRPGHTAPGLAELDSSLEGGFPGEAPLYRDHARAGVLRAAGNPESRLYFSGGQTKSKLPGRSEGQSYWEVARDHAWWGHPETASRAFVEGFARDSFENLRFPLAQFHHETGHLPAHITFIGWSFKAKRLHLHRQALN